MSIDILLATYNSQEFLREQLDSILNQNHSDFRIIIGDGGSRDGTPELLSEYAGHHPGRFQILPGERRYRSAENFARLLAASDADFVMFSDHDDIWKPDKIAVSLECFHRNFPENSDTPALIFTDETIVDRNLRVICDSSMRFQNFDPGRTELAQLLTQNIIGGNTMLFNRALREAALPIAPEALMHDCWVALCAAALGGIAFCPERTVLYRQHGGNVMGAASASPRAMLRKLRDGRQAFLAGVRQARALLEHLGRDPRLSAENRAVIAAYAAMEHQGFFARRRTALSRRFLKNTWRRNLLLLTTM